MTESAPWSTQGAPSLLAVLDKDLVCRYASRGWRKRLDLAMPGDTNPTSPQLTVATHETRFVTDAEIRKLEKVNMLAALEHANWCIWGNDGAAKRLGVKPSTLTYRMKVFGIRKEGQP